MILSREPFNSHLKAYTFPPFGKAGLGNPKNTVTNAESLGIAP